jgi:PKD domain
MDECRVGTPELRRPIITPGLRSFALRVGVATAIGLSALSVCAVRASAVLVTLANGATISYQPAPKAAAPTSGPSRASRFDAFFTNLDYNGGPVMSSNTNYAVYWRPAGAPAYPVDYKEGLNRFFEDLAHDSGGHENVDSVATQYNDSTGQFASYSSHFGGALVDEDPYPANGCARAPKCLTDEQIRNELANFVVSHKLPTDLSHEYFLLTPAGVESCFEPAGEMCSANVTIEPPEALYCAYHGNIPLVGGGQLVYSNDPFVNEKECDEPNHPNGKTSDSALIGGLSHEHVESITDPEPNNAWTDFGSKVGGEIGDKCRTREKTSEYGTPLGKAENGAFYNQVINGHKYWYQQEWSNKGHGCRQRLTFEASEAPAATFTSEPGYGTEVNFNATGSTAGEGVRYNWQFNDYPGPFPENTPFETQSLSVVHSFPQAGTYAVALTVFKADGTSYGTVRTVTARKGQFITFNSSPPSGATVGGPAYIVSATATSGLPVSLSIDPASASTCAISGAAVTFIGAGSCTIDANQAGTKEISPARQAQQSLIVAAQPLPAPLPSSSPASSSGLVLSAVKVDPKTGAITITVSNPGAGTLSWALTFQNGRFGVFAARVRCKGGLVKLKRRCRPARILYASGGEGVFSRGLVSFTVRPTASGRQALRKALRRRRGLPVSGTVAYQPAGGSAVSVPVSITVKPKR